MRLLGVTSWRGLRPSRAAGLLEVLLRQPESWTRRAMDPDWQWHDMGVSLAALQADYLAWLLWSRTKDGSRGRNRPSPIPRPGVPGYHSGGSEAESFQAVPVEDLDRALAAARS